MDDEAGGIFNIALSDSDAEETPAEKTARRTDQSESDFQAVKATYSAKIENGNVSDSPTICSLHALRGWIFHSNYPRN